MSGRIPELLAPAGGPQEFNAALAAGADALYCGFGNTFNARRSAQSFNSTTFEQACRKAHLAGAQVYVTVNVVIRSDEMPTVLALVRRAWLLGADAFIIQDWGLLREVTTRWPQISCHVSTQANVHDARGVRLCKELGVDRVTLSRELSLSEIKHIAGEGVDLECFCHGAICICYSGVCMMSSCGGNRSANRGSCAQPCRLPYDLVDDAGNVISSVEGGRPLCPKDFYSFDDLPALVQTGVRSLKVEGRLKGPDYLASVISAYREQLDDVAQNTVPTDEALSNRRTRLKRVFNRDFTNAYLRGTSGNELMSYERSNNRGELVGTVVDSHSCGSVKVRRGGNGGGRERLRTMHVALTQVVLDKSIGKGDLLEIRPASDASQFLTSHAEDDARAGQIITCKTARVMEAGSAVRVIRSQAASDEGARTSKLEVPRKRQVRVAVQARVGEPFLVRLTTVDGVASAQATGFVVERARTRAVSEQDIIEHVGRMGASYFEPVDFSVELDEGCGMAFSAVHSVRAQACDELERVLLDAYSTRTLKAAPSRNEIVRNVKGSLATGREGANEFELCALVHSPDAAHDAQMAGATCVYATTDSLASGMWAQGAIPVLDEICRERDHARLDQWVKRGTVVAVGNVSQIALARERGASFEVRGCIPVHNESCLCALVEAGACGIWLSPELSLEEISYLASLSPIPVGVMVLGRVRAMTCEHCVLQVSGACVDNCRSCALRRRHNYLRSQAGDCFPVTTDLQGRSRVYAAKQTDLTPWLAELMQAGVSRFGVDCTLLSTDQAKKAVGRLRQAFESAKGLHRSTVGETSGTSGHLFSPIV